VKVFVAGASGVIGRPLVRQLVAAGHEVVGTARSPEKAKVVREAGATPEACDALDREDVRRVMAEARPEVVINQLTKLPQEYKPRKIDYEPTNRLRTEGGANLLEAAAETGARRFISQSIAFLYAPEGDRIKEEAAAPYADAPEPFGSGVKAMIEHEKAVTGSDLEGLVLRYGWFYGPGTYYAADGNIAEQVRKRRFPIVGSGEGITSFLHIDDAAGATVAAVERGAPGVYNVVDDDPATYKDWLPVYAETLGAKPPRRVPTWLARLLAGSLIGLVTDIRGASNAKAKRELGWTPRYPSWRQGFREALG
jgi:nucleoside-diphosphate-sugar epimerase